MFYLSEDNELFETIQSSDINQNSNRSNVSFRFRSWEKVTRVLNDIDREEIKFFVFGKVESVEIPRHTLTILEIIQVIACECDVDLEIISEASMMAMACCTFSRRANVHPIFKV